MFAGLTVGRRVLLAGLAWVLGLVGVRVGLVPAEHCGVPSVAAVEAAADAAAGWAVDNLRPDGRFTYAYRIDDDTVEGGYNLPRHAGMVTALYQWAASGRPELVEPADRALDWMLDRRIEVGAVGGRPAIAIAEDDGSAKLGTVGLLLAGLIERRDLTGDRVHDELMEALGLFLVGQIEPRGSILAFWDGAPVPGRYSPFGTGEAMWALARMDRRDPEGGWRPPLRAVADHVALNRRAVEGNFLRLPDHWAAYAYAEMAAPGGAGLEPHHRDHIRAQAGDFALMSRYASQRTNSTLSRLTRGGTALGAGIGAMGEGLAGFGEAAELDPALADLVAGLDDRLSCTADLLVRRQAGAAEAAEADRPELVQGAWFRQGRTQVDDQQHTLSALVLWLRDQGAPVPPPRAIGGSDEGPSRSEP